MSSIPQIARRTGARRNAERRMVRGAGPILTVPLGPIFVLLTAIGLGGLLGPAHSVEVEPAYRHYVLKVWGVEDGLPGHQVMALTQAPEGFLWVGTHRGLARFDGIHFSPVAPPQDPEAFARGVTDLLVEHQGALWVGGRLCPWRLRDGVWEAFDQTRGWPGGAVWGLAQSREGAMFANCEKGLAVLDAGTTFVRFEGMAPRGEVVGEPHTGVYACSRHTVTEWTGDGWRPFAPVTELVGKGPIRGFLPTAKGGGWVAENSRISEYRDGQWRPPFERPVQLGSGSLRLCEDHQGNLWAGGNSTVLHCYRPDGRVLRCGYEEGLESKTIRCLLEDRSGNVWIGTEGNGLARLRPRLFCVYGREAGVAQPIIDSVVEAEPGRFWVGTQGSGLVPFEGGRFGPALESKDKNLNENSWVASVLPDGPGRLWIGSHMSGVYHLRDGLARPVPLEVPGPSMSNVRSLFRDAAGVVWIGTTTGLASWDDGKVTRHSPDAGLPHLYVNSLAQTPDGTLWVASWVSGLFRRQGEQFTLFDGDPGSLLDAPVALLVDHCGALWIGTTRGRLARYQNERLFVFGQDQPLLPQEIGGIVEDEVGDLWLSGPGGIARVSRESLEAAAQGRYRQVTVRTFGASDGLVSPQGRYGFFPSSCRSADGRLWFATMKGLAVVNPRDFRPLPVPACRIEAIEVDGAPFPPPADALTPLEIPPGSQRLWVRYSALEIGAPEDVVFEFRVGTSAEVGTWTAVGTERTATWLNPQPGQYGFEVHARGRDGAWGWPAGFRFHMRPFYWQTAWFRAALVCLLVAGCTTLVRLTTVRRMRLRAAQTERAAAVGRATELAGINQTLESQKQQLESQKLQLESQKEQLEAQKLALEESLRNVRTLTGLLPICSGCKKIRNDKGYWDEVEKYMGTRLDVRFSHGLCPACLRQTYPDVAEDVLAECEAESGEAPRPQS